jgi:hypothetical protein
MARPAFEPLRGIQVGAGELPVLAGDSGCCHHFEVKRTGQRAERPVSGSPLTSAMV